MLSRFIAYNWTSRKWLLKMSSLSGRLRTGEIWSQGDNILIS